MSSRRPSKPSAAREALVQRLIQASRESSTVAVFLHTALSERLGMSATDARCYELLHRVGPLTAGEIARRTGLAAASVTSLIDRLEAKGFVRRVRDTKDRRRVIVEALEREAELAPLYGPMADGTKALLERYDDAELALIVDYLERAVAWALERLEALRRAE